jgi:AraC-like DNA-binding protein
MNGPVPAHSRDSIEAAHAAEPSRILFQSSLVQVGQFRCPTGHPRFADSGPTKTYCFVFPRTAVWIQHEDGPAFVADSTVVPLYNPGQPYRRGRISRDGDRTDWFGVNASVLRDALDAHASPAASGEHRLFQHGFSRAPVGTFVRQRHLFEYVRATAEPDALYVEEAVLRLLDAVVAGFDGLRDVRTPQQRAVSEAARAQLNLSYPAHHDLTAFARCAGASVFHLCRLFKRHTGQTIHGYRNELRLRKSLELLGETDDILSVALALGYSGHSHFTAAFHSFFGITPSAYRRLPGRRRALAETAIRK